MTAVTSREPEGSVAYFIYHQTPQGWVEVGTNAEGDLLIRQTFCGKILATIPLGPCTQENLDTLVDQLQRLVTIFLPPTTKRIAPCA